MRDCAGWCWPHTPKTNSFVLLCSLSLTTTVCDEARGWPPAMPGPTSVPSDAQAGWHRGQSANSVLCLCCVVVVARAFDNLELWSWQYVCWLPWNVRRNTQIRNMHEMEDMKRAEELRVDDVSVQNLKRKSRDNSTAHFPITANARTNEFYERFKRIPGYWIKSQWKIVSRFQSTCDDSKFSLYAQPRQKIAAWHMEWIWIAGKRFWKSIFYVWFIHRSSSKNSIWRCTKGVTPSKSISRNSLCKTKRNGLSPGSQKVEDYAHRWWHTKSRHNSYVDICNKALDHEFYNTGGKIAEIHGRTAKTANIGTAI